MLDASELIVDRWPATDADWSNLVDLVSIPPATVRRGLVFDAADPDLARINLPAMTADGLESGPGDGSVLLFNDIGCPTCGRPVIAVYKPWGTEPIKAMRSEIVGGLEAIAWHSRHPR